MNVGIVLIGYLILVIKNVYLRRALAPPENILLIQNQGIIPVASHKKYEYPSTGLPDLNPTEKANQKTARYVIGLTTAQAHPKAEPLYALFRSDFASIQIWLR